jgi:DNA-binding CsgD family transcriptional regulator
MTLNAQKRNGEPTPEQEATTLTEREREVLVLIGKGLQSKEISEILGITVLTVNTHRRNIRHKTGIRTTAGLIRASIDHSLRDTPSDQT